MEIFHINDIFDLPKLERNSCTIGKFDGIHKGHKKLISETKVDGLKTLVITFEDLNKDQILMDTNQKAHYLEDLGVDYLLIFPFEVIKDVFYNEFIVMLSKLNVKNITCGKDFRFGYKREGDIIDLKKKFKLNILEDEVEDDIRISSTQIKYLLTEGLIEEANSLLDKPYTINGIVVEGNKIGRKLGFPTANIYYSNYTLPKNGVYLTIVTYKGKKYLSMTNIGHNPTLNAQEKTRLEVHILDFNEQIYGEELEISFIKYIREEKKYNSKDDLIKSLLDTIDICREHQNMIE